MYLNCFVHVIGKTRIYVVGSQMSRISYCHSSTTSTYYGRSHFLV